MDEAHTALGPGREFDVIRSLLRRWGESARGIGDDAAVLEVPPPDHLVASVDTMVDTVHFRRDWLTSSEIGYRAGAAALSDLAAMAAVPLGLLVALTLPAELLAESEALGDGLAEAARAARCPIVGGDTTRGERLSLTITVLGHTSRPLRRTGARAGDAIYVTGRLGGPAAAVAALRRREPPRPAHRLRYAHPVPRLAEALWLAGHGATSMIDISDGLTSDSLHLATASGVTANIDLDRLPLMEGLDSATAAVSGEEFELLCTAPKSLDVEDFHHTFEVELTLIGEVASDRGASVVFQSAGRRVDLPLSYDHFSI